MSKKNTQCKHCRDEIVCHIHEESCNGYLADCPDYEISECICVYCGENKWINPLKHIAEIAEFLKEQIEECQKILKETEETIKEEYYVKGNCTNKS